MIPAQRQARLTPELRLTPVVLLLADVGLADERQMRFAHGYAVKHELAIVVIAGHHPAAAAASVRVGRAEAVLMPVEPPSGYPAELADVTVLCARPSAPARAAVDVEAALIRTAVRNAGGDVGLVARLLGVPVQRVRAIGAGAAVRT